MTTRTTSRAGRALAALLLAAAASAAFAVPPLPIVPDGKGPAEAAAELARKREQDKETNAKALGAAKGTVTQVGGIVKDTLALQEALNASDAVLEPNYTPPGAPSVPSKCLEKKDCGPCYEKAYGDVDKSRIALERVRARFNYTHRFAKAGQALLTSMGGAAGGVAGLGANAENMKIDKSLEGFDLIVRNKNKELLAGLQERLKAVSQCEAKHYQNEDWYERYGYIYYQFMLASYSY